MHAATAASTSTTAVPADDPMRDAGAAYLRTAVWLLATAHGYGEAMARRDYVTAARWHRARQRAERDERAAWAAFQVSRLPTADEREV